VVTNAGMDMIFGGTGLATRFETERGIVRQSTGSISRSKPGRPRDRRGIRMRQDGSGLSILRLRPVCQEESLLGRILLQGRDLLTFSADRDAQGKGARDLDDLSGNR